jgi:hypothetical protein
VSTETKSSPRIRVFVPPTFEGVTSVAVLEEVIADDIPLEVVYTTNLDFREYKQFQDTEVVIALGVPYRGYNLSDDFYMTVDVPFMDFIHISTHGEEIKGQHIISLVSESVDPVKELFHIFQNQPESTILASHLTLTDKARYLVEAVNAYRTWTWETNDTTRLLLALYHASYKRMTKLLRGLSLQEVVKQHAPVIKGQLEKMNDYIERKRSMVKSKIIQLEGEACLLKVVYAEEYINELANDLLTREQTAMPVIVCVGRTTKSSDIFSIRTKGVHAGRVAHVINEGQGKDFVATVFAGISYVELMVKAIETKVSQ